MKPWKIALCVAPTMAGLLAIGAPSVLAAPATTVNGSAQTSTAATQDLGPTDATQIITASIYLKINNQDDLQNYIASTVAPGNKNYHKFLSVNQFVNRYAPSNPDINQVTNYLQSYGLTVNEVYPDHLVLNVSGTADQWNNAFNTSIHNYSKNGKTFRAPKKTPKVPDVLTKSILGIAGLSTAQAAQPLSITSSQLDGGLAPKVVLPTNGTATGVPGSFTVGDTANMYDINPLYAKGITGKGETIGIATLATFDPADAYTYWDKIGLKYTPNRITQVHVDGGGGSAGSDETALDVEQSGGLAPDANIIVYDAPPTDNGFLDVFYQAVSDNKVDSLSISWGAPEIFYVAGMNQGVDYSSVLTAFDQVFMEGAAQGISMFAASGDSGAYDTNRSFPQMFGFTTPLSVDAPASDPFITAAGGTTVPFTKTFSNGSTVNISQERPWAWDYLQNIGYPEFSVGDGGGVSTIWPRPWYQQGIAGMKDTEAGQAFTDSNGLIYGSPFTYNLPAGFAGRNVADISMDADPETGYLVYSSPDGGWTAAGGTSFVAPQMNGITALLDQDTGSRVGFLNPTLYSLLQSQGYGPNAPFNDINDGSTNWYYQAVNGYDPAAGVGTPNVANLAAAIQAQSKH